jgi:catechol 2,3-dioxygenase-like lactoylglutathione lyase family enzyme
VVFLHLRPGSPPATGGTVGTVINHVGFLVPNVQDAVAKWKAAGLPMQPGGNGRTDQAWITTADGLKVEILEDKAQTVPIRHHHVHYYVAEAAIPEIQAWYVKHFGAKPGMRGRNQAADIPGANLTFTKSDTPTIPTLGRVLDHIRLRREEPGRVLQEAGGRRHQAGSTARDAAGRFQADVHS